MKLDRLVSKLEEIAPPEGAEEFDHGRIGLIVRGMSDVEKVATAMDPTPHAIKKAVDMGAQILVTHHTLIWDPINIVDEDLALQLKLLLDSGISLYSMHTNYDNASGGVNDVLANIMDLLDVEDMHGGRMGTVRDHTLREFAENASHRLGCPVEYVGDDRKIIRRVVTMAGSGFRHVLEGAKYFKADVILSSELKNDVIRNRGDVALVNAPHYYTEAPAMKTLAKRMSEFLPATFIEDPPGIKVVNASERHI
ncbi:MAG TPA: Nif3-like dinuclear metal center hexameric protein [Methanocellaceae archaeon]